MRVIWKAAAIVVMVTVPSVAQAQAASTCLTEPVATALFEYALPELLDSVATKCGPELPKSAFLASQAPPLVAKYRVSGGASWPLAKAAFLKSAGSDDTGGKILAAMPDDAVKSLLSAGIATVITGDIKAKDCPRIDKLVAALAPLPAANLSTLIVQLMSLTGGGSGKDDDFQICKA
jgi:hypothetical protein